MHLHGMWLLLIIVQVFMHRLCCVVISSCRLINIDMTYNGSFEVNLTSIDYNIREDRNSLKQFLETMWKNGEWCKHVAVSYQHVSKTAETENEVKLSAVFQYLVDGSTENVSIDACLESVIKEYKVFQGLNLLTGFPKLDSNGTKVQPSAALFPVNDRYCCEDNNTCCLDNASLNYDLRKCECDPGYYEDGGLCIPCPVGTFKKQPGMGGCVACPNGTRPNMAATGCHLLGCPKEYSWGVRGVFSWEASTPGMYRKRRCPFGPKNAFVGRKCNYVPSSGAVWGVLDTNICKASARSESLLSLSEEEVTPFNVVDVVKRLLQLINQIPDAYPTAPIDSYDLYLTSVILEKVVNIHEVEFSEHFVDILDNIMNVEQQLLLESQEYNLTTTRILRAIDAFGNILLVADGSTSRVLQGTNIEIHVQLLSKQVQRRSNISLTFQAKDAPNNQPRAPLTPMCLSSEAMGHALRQNSKRLVGKLYRNFKLFPIVGRDLIDPRVMAKKVASVVLSGDFNQARIRNVSDAIEFKFESTFKGSRPVCVYWDFEGNDGFGDWSTRGCYNAYTTTTDYVTCRCNHLTNFAMLLTADPERYESDSDHYRALGIISYVGCAVSLVSAVLTLITYFIFQYLRRSQAQFILCHLCVALIGLLTSFLVVASHVTPRTTSCRVLGVLLHYFLLATFAWMAVEGVNMYLAFVKVMSAHVPRFMPKAYVISWGIPGLIVIATAATHLDNYSTDNSCFIHGIPFYVGVVAPCALVIVGNVVTFILTQYSLANMGKNVSQTNPMQGYQRLRIALSMMVLLGLTWTFGLVAIGDARLIFQYAFCVCNSLQGFAIFWFHCVRQEEVRESWKEFLCRSGSRKRKYTASSTLPALKGGSSSASPNLSKQRPRVIDKQTTPKKELHVPTTMAGQLNTSNYDLNV